MSNWRRRLESLPLLAEWHFGEDGLGDGQSSFDGQFSLDGQCLEGVEGLVHYIGGRHLLPSLGPVYLFSLSGPDGDRRKLIAKISHELGQPFETKKDSRFDILFVYWRDRLNLS